MNNYLTKTELIKTRISHNFQMRQTHSTHMKSIERAKANENIR